MSDFSIDHISKLANLALGDEEKKSLDTDIHMILDLVNQLNERTLTFCVMKLPSAIL